VLLLLSYLTSKKIRKEKSFSSEQKKRIFSFSSFGVPNTQGKNCSRSGDAQRHITYRDTQNVSAEEDLLTLAGK
jgi:hypothetical protein